MGFPERVPQAEFVCGHENEVHVIGHQAIGKHVRPAAAAGLGEESAVLRIVLVEERLLPAIAPLGDVVGQSRGGQFR